MSVECWGDKKERPMQCLDHNDRSNSVNFWKGNSTFFITEKYEWELQWDPSFILGIVIIEVSSN